MHDLVYLHVRDIRDIHVVQIHHQQVLLGVVGHHPEPLHYVHYAVDGVQELLIFEIDQVRTGIDHRAVLPIVPIGVDEPSL